MSEYYKKRRQQLEQAVDGAPIVLTAHTSMQLTGDMEAPFRQEASFLYLTGINEPDWVLIVNQGKSYLVEPNISQVHRLFDGATAPDEIIEKSGVDAVLAKREGDELLRNVAKSTKVVYTQAASSYEKYYKFVKNPAQIRLTRRLKARFASVKDCRPVLARMRAIKSEHEIATIEKATMITMDAFRTARELLKSAKYEYEIEAHLTHEFRRRGTLGHAYSPIVAGGNNALTLHYTKNNDPLPDSGLILIDAGALVDGYAADITRTYGRGKIIEQERLIHEATVEAEKAVINLIKPGVTLADYQVEVDKIMQEALASLGLLKRPSDAIFHMLLVTV
jgi:Xaa-Pro aminopeptidase